MATQKKRIVISLSDERAEEFEKLVRESGLTKSGLVTTWILKEIEKGQENKKRATAMALKSKYFLGTLYFMAKEKSRYFTFFALS